MHQDAGDDGSGHGRAVAGTGRRDHRWCPGARARHRSRTRFVAEGAHCVLANSTRRRCTPPRHRSARPPAVCDVTDRAGVDALLDGAIERHGSLDVLVARTRASPAAGRSSSCPTNGGRRSSTPTCVACSSATRPPGAASSRRAPGGGVVNVTSIMGARANPNTAAYAAAKAGVISVTHNTGAHAHAPTGCTSTPSARATWPPT